MHTVLLQLERLRRHYELAIRTYDHVSLLDLSHSLRIWVELKQALAELSPKFSNALSFKTAIPARKVLKAVRGLRYVFSYMPGGVVTYAAENQLSSWPDMPAGTASIAFKFSAHGRMELNKYSVISTSLEDNVTKALAAESVTRCTYVQWLASEVVRLAYHSESGALEQVTISREMIAKRVANTLDGSHPSAAGASDTDNRFDVPIQHLLRHKVGGLPLPYFILLKIAQDILHVAPRFLGINADSATAQQTAQPDARGSGDSASDS